MRAVAAAPSSSDFQLLSRRCRARGGTEGRTEGAAFAWALCVSGRAGVSSTGSSFFVINWWKKKSESESLCPGQSRTARVRIDLQQRTTVVHTYMYMIYMHACVYYNAVPRQEINKSAGKAGRAVTRRTGLACPVPRAVLPERLLPGMPVPKVRDTQVMPADEHRVCAIGHAHLSVNCR